MRPDAGTRAAVWLFVLWVCVVVFGFHDLRHDDAYITYRYGQNLARGRGLVFNPGQRIMGSTSPGQALLSAPVHALAGAEATPSVMSALGCLAWGAQVLLVWALLRPVLGRRGAGAAAALVALGAAGSAYWVALETHHAVAGNLAALLLARRGRWSAAAAMAALAGLFRPDAYLFGLLLAGECLRRRGRAAARPAAVFLVLALAWPAFATVYYGHPLPASLAAKFQKTGLVEYARHALEHLAGSWLPGLPRVPGLALFWGAVLGGAALLWRRDPWGRLLVLYPAAHLLAYLWMRPFVEHVWHLYPAVLMAGLLALVPALAALEVGGARRWVGAAALLGVAFLAGRQTLDLAITHPIEYWFGARDRAYRETAAFLLRHGDPATESVASVEVGTLAYTTDFPMVDLGGLVTRPAMTAELPPVRWLIRDRLFFHEAPADRVPVATLRAARFTVRVYDLRAPEP